MMTSARPMNGPSMVSNGRPEGVPAYAGRHRLRGGHVGAA